MSSQKGNSCRTRPQKYQNVTRFKNDLHDKTNKIKLLNSLTITDVCERCKSILEWKVKYKKYKPMKNPGTCVKCLQKCVTLSYRTVCSKCAVSLNICPKCGKSIEESSNETKNEFPDSDGEDSLDESDTSE